MDTVTNMFLMILTDWLIGSLVVNLELLFLKINLLIWKTFLAYTIRYEYDTIEEFDVDSKAAYSALSSTRSQKKKLDA